MTGVAEFFSENYLNPVYPYSFPDPYVLKFRGEYFAYCTGFWRDGKVFGVLHSRDLVNWREIGGAMEKLDDDAPFYWAPEVTYHNGKFYLYYSVGNETLMEIRVAVSGRPEGPFVDSGRRLTTEDFAIDAHVFEDTDGQRYFFYATDFLTHSHIGTGTVVDRMIDFFTLEGRPRPVTRAKYDWQVYDPNRKEKGGVRWHTVEGSFVLKRKDVYYEMFSGGNWQNPTYGVSFAVTDAITRDEEWLQFSDGENVLPILRTVPGLIVGPGHNSAVRGVNNRELYCVYHRWTDHGRVLAIDRMDFTGGGRMYIQGATHTPQPAPFKPQVLDFFDDLSGEFWGARAGEWRAEEGQVMSGGDQTAELICRVRAESFLCETWLRAADGGQGRFGITLKNAGDDVFTFLLSPNENQVITVWREKGVEQTQIFPLPDDFDFGAFHLLRIETDNYWIKVLLDENTIRFERFLEDVGVQAALVAQNTEAAFSGFALTVGFEDQFETDNLEAKGWYFLSESGNCRVEDQMLLISGEDAAETVIGRPAPEGDFELAVNIRIEEVFSENASFGIFPAFGEITNMSSFLMEQEDDQWIMNMTAGGKPEKLPLPGVFSPGVFHQFRFLKIGGKIIVTLETEMLAVLDAPKTSPQIALSARDAVVAAEMVRLTVL